MNYENMTKPELVSRLRQNDKVFEDTFGHVAVGVAHVALNGQFLKINKHFCEITGYPEEEIRENTFHNITFPEDISMQNRARKKVLDGENSSYTIEKRYVKKDRSTIWVNLTVTLIRESCGKPKYFISIIDDITQRKKDDEKMRKLSHATEYSSASVVITDNEGNVEYSNPRFTELTGYSPEEIIGKNPRILKSDKTPPETYIELWKTISSGNEWKGEFCNRRKNGELYWESASISPVKDDENNVTHFIAVKEDITERHNSNKRLSAQNIVAQVLAESSTLKEASGKILKAICTALEWDLGEIWIFDQQDSVLHNEEIWHVSPLKSAEFKAATKQITFPAQVGLPGRVWENAKPLWIEDVVYDTKFIRASIAERAGLHGAFGFPIIGDNEVLGVICFYSQEIRKPDRDLLDMMSAIGSRIGLFIKRKQAEEALVQSDRLKSLGTIAAGVAHDFNNILAVISGKAQLIEMEHESNKQLTNELSTIMRAADDGAQITSKMLRFTKTRRSTTEFVLSNILDLINQTIDFTKPRWKNMAQVSGINYHIDKEGMKEIPEVLCSPAELREVFINLISNALNAMPDGGSISFSTWSDENTVFISISDTGTGMTEGVKKKIFDPFFTTRRPEGTGLGMSTSYGIIEEHGGKIDVESEVGKGTTFTLSIPNENGTTQRAVSSESFHEIKEKGLRILVVDDNEDMRSVLNQSLSSIGHIVKTVENGTDALELAKREGFDIVLCDLIMPDIYGYDVIKALNGLEKSPKIGIITGWGEELNPQENEGLKVDFIVKKPFKLSYLTKQISEAFAR